MNTGVDLFNKLFDTPEVETEEKKKGRNPNHIAARNEQLLHRYIYYGIYTDKRNDAVMDELVKEFHLEKRTIFNVLSDNFDVLIQLRKNPPSLKAIRDKYPHIVWG